MAGFIDEILLIATFIAAGLLHGITGIGITLVTTAALASSFGLPHAIVMVLFPAMIINAMSWLLGGGRSIWQNLTHYLRQYWLLALTSLAGSLIGAKLLVWVNPAYLMIMLAGVIGFYVLTAITGRRITLPDTPPVLIGIGLIAGVIGGATNAMSPILLMYLLSASDDKNTIAKVGNLCYFLGKVAQIIVLREPIMALSSPEWLLIGILTGASIVALLVGIRLRQYLPQERFRQLILLILTLLGLKVGWQGLSFFVG